MTKINGTIRCPKCLRSIQFHYARKGDFPTIDFYARCGRCKTKVDLTFVIKKQEEQNATKRPPVEHESNTGDDPTSTGEETNVLPDKKSEPSEESEEDKDFNRFLDELG